MRSLLFIQILLVALLFPTKKTEACSCARSHPQTKFCDADFVVLIHVKEVIVGNNRDPTIYRVQVNKAFKKLTSVVLIDEIYTSSSDSLCGIDLKLNKNYVVSGRAVSGKPFIDLCHSIWLPWLEITQLQIDGFTHLYKESCQCEIVNPRFMDTITADKNKCLWGNTSAQDFCLEKHGTCLRDHGACSWFLSKSYTNCIEEYNRK